MGATTEKTLSTTPVLPIRTLKAGTPGGKLPNVGEAHMKILNFLRTLKDKTNALNRDSCSPPPKTNKPSTKKAKPKHLNMANN